jgi:hypothetical protein
LEFFLDDVYGGFEITPLQFSQSGSKSSFPMFSSQRGSKSQIPLIAPSDSKNKDILLVENSQEHPHRIHLANLYGKCYLLYLNSFSGKMILYLLSYEKVQR